MATTPVQIKRDKDDPASLFSGSTVPQTKVISLLHSLPKRPYMPVRVMPVFKPAGNAGRVPVGTALLETAGCIAMIDMDEEDRVQTAKRSASSGQALTVRLPRDYAAIGAKLHTTLVQVSARRTAVTATG